MSRSRFLLLGFVTLCLIFTVNAQFFVDIEHSLPRLGKRMDGYENFPINTNKLATIVKSEILDSIKDMTNEEAKVYFNKVLQVIRILGKRD
ncbi:unnamed protein product [Brachionus calyciflorus]|uniref:Uncharacterized protein n=1 Tax=Brachionus calyciflorus TaxID=104777 RepID=A0A813M7E9_9BILA|nr:unnamed protein product [Brachionus calyciflorus]